MVVCERLCWDGGAEGSAGIALWTNQWLNVELNYWSMVWLNYWAPAGQTRGKQRVKTVAKALVKLSACVYWLLQLEQQLTVLPRCDGVGHHHGLCVVCTWSVRGLCVVFTAYS